MLSLYKDFNINNFQLSYLIFQFQGLFLWISVPWRFPVRLIFGSHHNYGDIFFSQKVRSWVEHYTRTLHCPNNLHTALTNHYSEENVTMTFPGQGLRLEERRKKAKHFSVCKKKCTRPFHTQDLVRRVSENQSFLVFVFLFTHFWTNTFNFSFRQRLTAHKVLRINCTIYKISTTKTIHRRGSAGWVWTRGVNDKKP